MKKFIFALIISLFIIPGVNAEMQICSSSANLAKPNNFISGFYSFVDKNFTYVSGLSSNSAVGPVSRSYNGYIKVEPNITYYFSAPDSGASRLIIAFFDADFNQLTYTSEKSTSISAISPSNAQYAVLYHYYGTLNGTNYYFSTSNEYVEFVETTCNVEPEIPDDSVITDSTLDDFYSIYTSKLQSLAQYATNNKFILGTIGIILLLVALEIILNLFKKGGYR